MSDIIMLPAYVAGITTLKDKTIKISLETNEISPEVMASLYTLHKGGTCIAAFRQTEFTDEHRKALETINLDSAELGNKTPSERMRAVLYRLWENKPEGHNSFPLFYEFKMSQLIEWVKRQID